MPSTLQSSFPLRKASENYASETFDILEGSYFNPSVIILRFASYFPPVIILRFASYFPPVIILRCSYLCFKFWSSDTLAFTKSFDLSNNSFYGQTGMLWKPWMNWNASEVLFDLPSNLSTAQVIHQSVEDDSCWALCEKFYLPIQISLDDALYFQPNVSVVFLNELESFFKVLQIIIINIKF